MTLLDKRASLALADLTATLNRWLDAEIAALTPGEREHFDAHHAAGLSRYDALLAAREVGTETVRSSAVYGAFLSRRRSCIAE
jgi:hypothetical protein